MPGGNIIISFKYNEELIRLFRTYYGYQQKNLKNSLEMLGKPDQDATGKIIYTVTFSNFNFSQERFLEFVKGSSSIFVCIERLQQKIQEIEEQHPQWKADIQQRVAANASAAPRQSFTSYYTPASAHTRGRYFSRQYATPREYAYGTASAYFQDEAAQKIREQQERAADKEQQRMVVAYIEAALLSGEIIISSTTLSCVPIFLKEYYDVQKELEGNSLSMSHSFPGQHKLELRFTGGNDHQIIFLAHIRALFEQNELGKADNFLMGEIEKDKQRLLHEKQRKTATHTSTAASADNFSNSNPQEQPKPAGYYSSATPARFWYFVCERHEKHEGDTIDYGLLRLSKKEAEDDLMRHRDECHSGECEGEVKRTLTPPV